MGHAITSEIYDTETTDAMNGSQSKHRRVYDLIQGITSHDENANAHSNKENEIRKDKADINLKEIEINQEQTKNEQQSLDEQKVEANEHSKFKPFCKEVADTDFTTDIQTLDEMTS